MKRANPRLIGLFVIVAVALAVAGVLLFGSGQLFRDTHTFTAYFDANVSGLSRGAPVKFRGVEVGDVRQVLLNLADRGDAERGVSIPVVFRVDADRIRSRGVTLDIGDRAVVDSLIDAGLRASLATESLVTGRQYIQLNMEEGREETYRGGDDAPYPEIPTVSTGFEELQDQLYSIVRRAAAIEFDSLVARVVGVVGRIEELVGTPDVRSAVGTLANAVSVFDSTLAEARRLMVALDSTVVPLRTSVVETSERFRRSADELDSALGGIRETLSPGSPVTFELEATLRELSAAARSFRALAEYLERNPSALIRGRAEPEP